jgi:hypothetical protein
MLARDRRVTSSLGRIRRAGEPGVEQLAHAMEVWPQVPESPCPV